MMPTPKILQFVGPTHDAAGHESTNSYQHRLAVDALGCHSPFAKALADMLRGWERYAEAHQDRYGEHIGNDHIIGDYWAEVGLAIKRLLDGETGGLDCGSIAQNITNAIAEVGIQTDGYVLTDKGGAE